MAPKPAAHRDSETTKYKFLLSLSAGNTVKQAAIDSGINRRTAYDWRDQSEGFRVAWEEAIQDSNDDLVQEVRRRALDINYRNSHLLLMFLVKARMPEFRENFKQEITVTHDSAKEFSFTSEEVDKAIDILTKAKKPSPQAHEDA